MLSPNKVYVSDSPEKVKANHVKRELIPELSPC